MEVIVKSHELTLVSVMTFFISRKITKLINQNCNGAVVATALFLLPKLLL